jgi:transmembrane sensor
MYNRFWLLAAKRLSGDATKEELHELDLFISEHPETQQMFEEAEKVWLSSTNIKTIVTAEHFDKLRKKIAAVDADYPQPAETALIETTTSPRRRLKFVVVPAIIVLIVSGFLVFKKLNSKNYEPVSIASANVNSVFAQKGSKPKITLPDGSTVLLNADSRIYYGNDFATKRELRLEGEAYFDVVKNPNKPFIIHTSEMDVKVLGTSFNVRSYPDESFSEASLIKGSIEVHLKDRNRQPIILKPNEKINVSKSAETLNEVNKRKKVIAATPTEQLFAIKKIQPNIKDNVIKEIAWTQNKLYLQAERLDRVALMLERWFGKRIQVTNESLKSVRYTGNFEDETLEEVLQALQLSAPFRYKIENETVVIY